VSTPPSGPRPGPAAAAASQNSQKAVTSVPAWVASQRRARGDCERCGQYPAVTEWAGTGQLICWECCESKRAQSMG
jgi:hypothetical protein